MIESCHYKRLVKAFTSTEIPRVEPDNPIFSLLRDHFYHEQVIKNQLGCYMPMPFPTGVGKTFNTISLILESILDDICNEISAGESYSPRYCFYVTNSVDNVFDAYSNLKARVKNSPFLSEIQKEVIYERILYAPANATSILDLLNTKNGVLEKVKKLFSIDDKSSLGKELELIASEQETLALINVSPAQKNC